MVKRKLILTAYRRCDNVPTWVDICHVRIKWVQGPHGRSVLFFLLQLGNTTSYLPFGKSHSMTSIGIYSEHAIPVDIADRFNASFPYHMSIGLSQRSTAKIAELDK